MRELVVILVIALLLFGAKRVRSLGTDLGSAIRGFRREVGTEHESDTTRRIGGAAASNARTRPEVPAEFKGEERPSSSGLS